MEKVEVNVRSESLPLQQSKLNNNHIQRINGVQLDSSYGDKAFFDEEEQPKSIHNKYLQVHSTLKGEDNLCPWVSEDQHHSAAHPKIKPFNSTKNHYFRLIKKSQKDIDQSELIPYKLNQKNVQFIHIHPNAVNKKMEKLFLSKDNHAKESFFMSHTLPFKNRNNSYTLINHAYQDTYQEESKQKVNQQSRQEKRLRSKTPKLKFLESKLRLKQLMNINLKKRHRNRFQEEVKTIQEMRMYKFVSEQIDRKMQNEIRNKKDEDLLCYGSTIDCWNKKSERNEKIRPSKIAFKNTSNKFTLS